MPVERKEYEIAPAGTTYSRGVKAGNLLFISGCTCPNDRVHLNLNMCDTIRIGVGDFLWSGDHPFFGQPYPPELIR